jgi:hypothetical protein
MTDGFSKFISGQPILDDVKSKGMVKVLTGSKAEFSSLRGGLLMSITFLEMINSSAFKSKICKGTFIQTLSYMIDNCEATKG